MSVPERTGRVTLRGRPVTLLGPEVRVGEPAPGFRVVDAEFKPVGLADWAGQPVLLSAVPSLDTPVCSLQTQRFNAEMARLPAGVVAATISMDLPFAQKRFCQAEQVDRLLVLSDHVWREFGLGYGVLIKDMGLLARSVFVIGRDGRLLYQEIVPEVADHPDYDRALEAVKKAAG